MESLNNEIEWHALRTLPHFSVILFLIQANVSMTLGSMKMHWIEGKISVWRNGREGAHGASNSYRFQPILTQFHVVRLLPAKDPPQPNNREWVLLQMNVTCKNSIPIH